jgi:hypothetical protein
VFGDDWCVTDGHWSDDAMLRSADGEQIHLSRTRPTRLVLWAIRPHELAKHWPHDAPRRQITVADTKTPQQIATETTRRLLPGYRQIIAQAWEHKRRSDQQNAARDELAAALARALNTVVFPSSSRPDEHERTVEIGEP